MSVLIEAVYTQLRFKKKKKQSCGLLWLGGKGVDGGFWDQLQPGAVSLQARLGFSLSQCKLELKAVGGAVDHGTAFGRIAFSCAKEEVTAPLPSPQLGKVVLVLIKPP